MSIKSLREKALGSPEDVAALKKADAALHAYSEARPGHSETDPEYLRLTAAANEAASRVPWIRR